MTESKKEQYRVATVIGLAAICGIVALILSAF